MNVWIAVMISLFSVSMARPWRIQFPGARYHVLNRGNYRTAVFRSAGAAQAFERVLDEAARRHAWRLHAHTLIPNHFHLALETSQANLAEGMHWMLGTFASRFNRWRSENGHLFQGRYQALLVEDDAHLVRLINYIHLNPVHAGLVAIDRMADFRWSSLRQFAHGPRPSWLASEVLLQCLGLDDTAAGWRRYLALLAALAGDTSDIEAEDREFTTGWAIGSPTWKREMATAHFNHADASICGAERQAAREARWQSELGTVLAEAGKSPADILGDAKSAPWKIAAAVRLRLRTAAQHRWIARALNMGCAASVRVYVSRKINL